MTCKPPFGPTECPECGHLSEPYDWNEVDIGVGTQTFDHTWECPKHGEWCLRPEGTPIFRDESVGSKRSAT